MKRAWSLIELLVVISIITILAAILFPVFNQAILSAKKTQCLSGLRQIAMATTMYAHDFGYLYPHDLGLRVSPGTFSDTLAREFPLDRSNRFDGHPVAVVLEPYVKNKELWFSPLQERRTPENGPSTNYQVNAYIVVNTILEPGRPHGGPVSEGDVVNPPRTMLWQNHFMQGLGAIRGGLNRVACDGHARWVLAKRVGSWLQLRWWVE